MVLEVEPPDKLYFKIGEVASLLGVKPHVLRYWESEFRIVRPRKTGGGQRLYSRRDVEALVRIRQLLHEERYTIAGARRKLAAERADAKRQPGAEGGDDAPDEAEPGPPPAGEIAVRLAKLMERCQALERADGHARANIARALDAVQRAREEAATLLKWLEPPRGRP